jgi:MinD-like ATPase involved in chromosome partitioning or flagellar assembly
MSLVATIASIHSFRGGTGKSNTTANVSAMLASLGQRVGVIDADIQSPGIHNLFGMSGDEVTASLNDFLWHGKPIAEIAHDVTESLDAPVDGRIYLIPSSMQPGEITRVLREGYDAQLLTRGVSELVQELELDVLLIDTHPGLNEETLLSLVISNALLIIMRPDKQDYEGTGITARVAKELEVPNIFMVVNKAPSDFDPDAIAKRVEETYGCPVVAVIPHSDDLMRLASEGIFVLRYPEHPMTDLYRGIAASIDGVRSAV